jgi:membrane protease YdiL (CAAX protease family)
MTTIVQLDRRAAALPAIRLAMLLTVLYGVPTALLASGIVPFRFRFHVLIGMSLAAALFSFFARHTTVDLGMRLGNLKRSLILNGAFTAAVITALWIVHSLRGVQRFPNTPSLGFYVFYVLISCPTQEFIFRAFLWAELERSQITSATAQLFVMAVPFTLAHLVYRDTVTLLVTLVAGLGWAIIYRRAPNAFGVTLSHSLAGLATIAFGFI